MAKTDSGKKIESGSARAKKKFESPKIRSEKVTQAALGNSCNGMTTATGRKASMPCSTLLS